METIPNVLAQRYASPAMCDIWSPIGKVKLERQFWIALMRAQRNHGLEIPAEAIEAYEAVADQVDLDEINERERKTRHDVKARIETFNALAGFEHIHKGMTSRDLTENVEQLQVFRALQLLRLKSVAIMRELGKQTEDWRGEVITARTHNVPAQPTLMGKRLAMFGEEFSIALDSLHNLISRYPARGLKGAVGTQVDQIQLFDGNRKVVHDVEKEVLTYFGLPKLMDSVGQVYPRTLDFQVVSTLYALSGGPSSFAKTLRLMAGHELASEGFAPGQVGSSAMPHKMNSRSCERINGFQTILRGHLSMAAGLSGDQWNEGDVSCSVVRRVVIPDAFFALDGLLETFHTVLRQMEVFPAIIQLENRRSFPFLLTTTVLMESVKAGVGRETAHSVIKKHALEVVSALRQGQSLENDLMARLAGDPELGLSRDTLDQLLDHAAEQVGAANEQIDRFLERVKEWEKEVPEAESYQPLEIL